jgi:hypothetical protein
MAGRRQRRYASLSKWALLRVGRLATLDRKEVGCLAAARQGYSAPFSSREPKRRRPGHLGWVEAKL